MIVKNMFWFMVLSLYSLVHCPPVFNTKKETDNNNQLDYLLGELDYSGYLSQVINELQSDAEFSKHVIDLNNTYAIANGLKHASDRVRSKLDELKRMEIARLNKLQAEWTRQTTNGKSEDERWKLHIGPIDTSHLDDMAPGSFNPEDLRKLIDRTSEIFKQMDKRNDETYKYYEMEKKAAKLAETERISNEKLRKSFLKKWFEDEIKKRSQHKTILNPGSAEHLRSIWKDVDHMDDESFNERSFFFMHDINSDGNWDIAELETLMQKELDKVYDLNDNITDEVERYHEMQRMRNAFLGYADKDNNHLISLEEYNKWIVGDEYKKHKDWKIQEELEPEYSLEEFEQYFNDYISKHPDLHQFLSSNESSTN